MMSKEAGEHVTIKLDDGEDLFGCLESAAKKHELHSGILLMGVGMLKDFEISFFNMTEKKYESLSVKEPHELISMMGSLAVAENGEFMPHLHVSLGAKDHTLLGGHLKRATVAVVNEITILKLPQGMLTRKLNPETMLYELVVQ